MVLWPVVNPDTSRSAESHHSTDHRRRRPSCCSNTLGSSCRVLPSSSLLEILEPGSAAAAQEGTTRLFFMFFFSFTLSQTRADASRELFETTFCGGQQGSCWIMGRGSRRLGPRPARLRWLVGDVSPPPRAAAFTAVSRNHSQELALSLYLPTTEPLFCRLALVPASDLPQHPPSPSSLWELGAHSQVCCDPGRLRQDSASWCCESPGARAGPQVTGVVFRLLSAATFRMKTTAASMSVVVCA